MRLDSWRANSVGLAHLLEQTSSQQQDATALIFRSQKTSYRELSDKVRRCATGLAKLGVKRGDRFGLMTRNCPEFVIVWYALVRLGAIAVPVNFLLRPSEVEYIFEHCEAVGAATQPAYLETVSEATGGTPGFIKIVFGEVEAESGAVPFDSLLGEDPHGEPDSFADDIACLLYTSGTTGKPKGVMLSHRNLLANVESCSQILDIRSDDVFMCLLPMFHTFALTTCVLLPLCAGSPTVVVESIQPFKEVATQLMKHKCTIFIAVPPIFAAMARMPFWKPLQRFIPLRFSVSGAAPLPRGVQESYEAKFGVPLLEGYGLTETSPVASLNPLNGEHRPGTVGVAIPGVEVTVLYEDGRPARLGDVGEVCIRGENVMVGYFRDPEATRQAIDRDGWLHSGDLGRMQEGGYLVIVDRAKDMIIVKGLNVYSREVEDVLLLHPAVAEAAVVGLPNEFGDELIKAFIVLKEGKSATKNELFELCREHLAPYKMPRDIIFTSILPKNAIGKVLKRELRA